MRRVQPNMHYSENDNRIMPIRLTLSKQERREHLHVKHDPSWRSCATDSIYLIKCTVCGTRKSGFLTQEYPETERHVVQISKPTDVLYDLPAGTLLTRVNLPS